MATGYPWTATEQLIVLNVLNLNSCSFFLCTFKTESALTESRPRSMTCSFHIFVGITHSWIVFCFLCEKSLHAQLYLQNVSWLIAEKERKTPSGGKFGIWTFAHHLHAEKNDNTQQERKTPQSRNVAPLSWYYHESEDPERRSILQTKTNNQPQKHHVLSCLRTLTLDMCRVGKLYHYYNCGLERKYFHCFPSQRLWLVYSVGLETSKLRSNILLKSPKVLQWCVCVLMYFYMCEDQNEFHTLTEEDSFGKSRHCVWSSLLQRVVYS